MSGPYINQPGYEVPDNTIVVVPFAENVDCRYEEIIEPLAGKVKREWFDPHAYYCLPITVGNQMGFLIRSLRDFEVIWDGTDGDAVITMLDNEENPAQHISNGFANGIITIQNGFSLKTPIGINLMTIQPPNLFLPGIASMTGIIECDQIRRDFTFNIKMTVPNLKVTVKKGDPLAAFIPIPRYFVENFEIKSVHDIFDKELYLNEIKDQTELSRQRLNEDKQRPHESGRRYFNGVHAFGEKYDDHQKGRIGKCPYTGAEK